MSPDPKRYRPLEFISARWLPGPHLQTVVGKFLRPALSIPTQRLRVELPDGDFVDLDVGPETGPDAPLVLILHGLEGSIQRRYARLAIRALLARGIRPVGLNFRSCSGEPNRNARFYHSGDTGDLRFVLESLSSRFPGRPLGAVGFSLGGNVLLKWLGEEGATDAGPLRAAATISVPFDLAAGTRIMETGTMGRVYTHYFLRSLRTKARAKQDRLRSLLDLEAALRARTLREWDDIVTAPLHGFKDASDYYSLSSSQAFLPQVRVPTLLIQADDDPFLPSNSLPRAEVETNPYLQAAFTRGGGHVGFVSGPSPWSPHFWAEEEAARFLSWALTGGSPGAIPERLDVERDPAPTE